MFEIHCDGFASPPLRVRAAADALVLAEDLSAEGKAGIVIRAPDGTLFSLRQFAQAVRTSGFTR